jgi:hypothetical protein
MNSEIYLIAFLIFYIVAIIFAHNRWPEFFENDDKDPPVYPML